MGEISDSALLLDVKIIGAGIAGLATALALRRQGHTVTVLEAMPALSEFGAGIQMRANATRIIHAWNLQSSFLRVVNQPAVTTFRRYADDSVIGELPDNPMSSIEYGFPHWQIYRPDFQDLLYDAVRREGVEVRCGCPVKSVDADEGILTLENGSREKADLIVAADGIRSRTRSTLTSVQARAFKEYVFRAVIPKAKMEEDPATAELMAGHLSMTWCGPQSAVLAYTVAGGSLYNILLSVPRPSDAPLAKWSQPGDLKEVEELAQVYSPLVRKLWSLVDSCAKWTLGDVPPVESYVSDSGKFVMVGDAAHAIIPHAGQGGSMALEDAVALAEFLAHLPSKHHLPPIMAAYSAFRQTRVENVRRMAHGNQHFLCMEDGPEQVERDQKWAAMTAGWQATVREAGGLDGYREKVAAGGRVKADPDAVDLGTPEGREYIYGYDVFAEAKEAAAKVTASLA